MDVQRDLILKSFLAESEEGFTEMEQAILELEASPNDLELIQVIFRVVHTMKGNAGILGLESLLAFAHTVEDLLDALRKGCLSVNPEVTSLLLASLDGLRQMTAAAGEGTNDTGENGSNVLKRISLCLKRPTATDSPGAAQEADRTEQHVEATATHGTTGSPPEAANFGPVAPLREAAHTLRVDMDKLDRLLNLVSEITIARGRIEQMLDGREKPSIDEIREAYRLTDSLHVELQDTVLKARMVSVGPLFRRYSRTVRDLAEAHGKMARLRLEGEDVEVDTSVVEHLKDPLLHMIRNALDHGIESPEARQKAGKPAEGTITVRAKHEGGNILIEVSDDGAGVDRGKIIDVGRKKGLIADAEPMSDQDVYQLIFESGFSTTHEVNDMSGRGVGMDVVRRNVQALRGSVNITSEPGAGSVVHLRIPLTLAIIEGFAVGVGQETYIIPLDQVVECLELPEEETGATHKQRLLSLRNDPLPYVYLRDYFAVATGPSRRQSVVVVQRDSLRAGLAVDTLLGATQTVIKPLPPVFKEVPGVSGLAILGNGRVALILDIQALLRDFQLEQASFS